MQAIKSEDSLVNIKLWVHNNEIEEQAMRQLQNISTLKILSGDIAVMPDVHMGKGATVGSVIPTVGAVIPSAVGVDIGCGMVAVQTNLTASDLPDNLRKLRLDIEKYIPVGFNSHKKPKESYNRNLKEIKNTLLYNFDTLHLFEEIDFNKNRMVNQLGTLGGGNHFIEICLDENFNVWIMIHSGSRNVGKTIGEFSMQKAKEYMSTLDYTLPDKDLSWLKDDTKEFIDYTQALTWAQMYARLNRDLMLESVLQVMNKTLLCSPSGRRDAHRVDKKVIPLNEAVNCHHNYLSEEFHNGSLMWITRKGAISARKGELGIIPSSMGSKSFIVRGKGNKESYCSCSHGAGRVHSRTAARKLFTLDDLTEQTKGVECRQDGGVLDEIPSAYKDIDNVMKAQEDLVEVVHTLKQILCIKG